MRVLLSGGNKTQNIVAGISKGFQSSGVEFLVVKFLDDIENLFSRGDYFDKAIITEQSITRENSISDELEIRKRINDFAISMRNRDSKFNFVFLTQREDMALIVSEEILQIAQCSVVVLMKPPYHAKFFKQLIVSDINQLPDEWIYVPALEIPEDEEQPIENEDLDEDLDNAFKDMDATEEDNFKLESVPDFEQELLDGLDVESQRISDEIPVDNNNTLENEMYTDEDFNLSDDTDNNDIESNNNLVGLDDNYSDTTDLDLGDIPISENDFENNSNNLGGFSNDFGIDDMVDLDDTAPIKQAGELPTYIEEVNNSAEEGMQVDNMNDNYNINELPGFDIEDEPEIEDTSDFIPDTMSYDGEMYDSDNTQSNNNATLYPDDDFGMGFDKSDYGDSDEDDDYQNNVENNVNEEMEQAGFNPYDYGQEQQVSEQEPDEEEQPVAQQKQKRGFLGKLKSKKTSKKEKVVAKKEPVKTVEPTEEKAIVNNGVGKVNPAKVKESLRPFASRGNSIVVTGCGGCGTSVIAYNIANIVSQLGYTVLLVDMDTEGRTQSYISKDNYESMEPDGANLMSAVNSSNGINTHIAVVKQGFHLLTMGLGTDTAPINELLHKEKISRFINLGKTSHDFVIYDIPFSSATGYLSDITYMADNLVLVTDASNWGITKTMLAVCNIESEDMQDTIFGRAQIVFNKYRNLYKVLGKKVKTCHDIKKVMDQKVLELIGEDPGFYFEHLHIAGIINDDPDFENGWFESVQYSDTKKGQDIFLTLIENIVLKK